jgi:Leucine-rich repeat (LRR) protein
MDKQTAIELIDKAFQLRETELDLSGYKLEELPSEIGKLIWLEKLNLESARVRSLPKEIRQLQNLKELILLDNDLADLPREIGDLSSLEYLNLSFNQRLRDIPLELEKLGNLNQLDFDGNNFGYFPFSFTKLNNLSALYMDGNQIEYLPAEIGNLHRLTELDLNANLLTSLPIEFGNLESLKVLDISRNSFREMPSALFNLPTLEVLFINENYITKIDSKINRLKELKYLNLGNSGQGLRYWAGLTDYDNEIENLPIEITQLNKLEFLDLTGNPLPISPEILEKVEAPTTILNAYFGSRTPMQKRHIRVFLCHSSDDKPQIRKLYKKLTNDNVDVWLDEENLIPGQDWEYEISKALDNSDAIIICLSKKSISKEGFVQKEIRFALDKAEEKPEGTIFIIPVLLEDCEIPQRLSKRHYAKLFEKNGYALLLKALNIRGINLGLVS